MTTYYDHNRMVRRRHARPQQHEDRRQKAPASEQERGNRRHCVAAPTTLLNETAPTLADPHGPQYAPIAVDVLSLDLNLLRLHGGYSERMLAWGCDGWCWHIHATRL